MRSWIHSTAIFAAVVAAGAARAQCPANLSVSPPDANGNVTVNASTNGSCGTTSLALQLDGGGFGGKDCANTPSPMQCNLTTTIAAACIDAFNANGGVSHTVKLTARCQISGTDSQGNPTCTSPPSTSTTSGFSIQPTPTVNLSIDGPDIEGHATAHIRYSFPYNATFGRVYLFVDGDGRTCARRFPSDTCDSPLNFACAFPGTHTIVAKALSCPGTGIDPTNPNFIATDTKTVAIAGQTTVSGSYDDDTHTLTVQSHFPNTDALQARVITVYADGAAVNVGSLYDCIAHVDGTCSGYLLLSCGVSHQIRLVARACNSSEGMYNAESSFTVTPLCTNATACRQVPSTSPELGGVMADAPNGGDSCQMCQGRPVHVGSGDVSVSIPLFTIYGNPMSLPFTLTYHSLRPTFPSSLDVPLGPGWTHLFNMSIRETGPYGRLQLYTPTGNRMYFDPLTNGLWSATRPAYVSDTIAKDDAAGTYILRYTNGGRSTFSVASGKWLSTTDRWGNSVTGSYDASGNLIVITDPQGRQVTLEYSNNQLSRVLLPNGAAWKFTYTPLGSALFLSAIADPVNPSSNWRTFNYVARGNAYLLSEMRDAGGKLLEGHNYEYFGDFRGVSSYSDGSRDSYTFEYDNPSRGQTKVTRRISDTISQVTIFTVKAVKGTMVATQIDGVCASCGAVTDSQTLTYDGAGRALSSTDAGGHVTRYTYDSFGNILTKTEAAGTGRERTTTFEYALPGWPTFITRSTMPSATGNGLRIAENQWNADETVLTAKESGNLSADPNSTTTISRVTAFDSKHRLISDDGPRSDVADVTSRTYFADSEPDLNRRGRMQQTTSPSGLTTSFDHYDVFGTARRVVDPNGVVTELQTDLRGRTTSSTSKAVPSDPNESVDYLTTRTYDSRDRLVEQTNARGARLRFGYEDGTNALKDSVRVDFNGNEVERKHLTLNLAGDKVAEEDQSCALPAPACASWTTKRTIAFRYDAKNRLVEIDQPEPAGARVLYQYDQDGRLRSVQDENHSSPNTLYTYDELNRLSTVAQTLSTAPGGVAVTHYAYDAQDNLASVTDPNNNITTYSYDDFGRMQTQESPVTGTTAYSYDPAGNLIATTDANGATTTRTYDPSNRIVGAVSVRSGLPSETVTWIYDDPASGNYGKGRMAEMIDPTGSTVYRHERRGLLSGERKTIGGDEYATSYRYDAAGNRTQVVYPSGRIVSFGFDFADRPSTAAIGSDPLVTSTIYAPFGPATRIAYGNGTVKSVAYDTRYRPLENKLTGSATVADYQYAEDAAGNITQIHDALDPAYNRDFGYDDLNRLVVANGGTALWGAGSFAYDAMGNIRSLALGNARTATFAYSGSAPELTNVTENGSSKTVSYDAAGNEIAVGAEAFGYTSRNSLASSQALKYEYDGRGIRTITTLSEPLATIAGSVVSAADHTPVAGAVIGISGSSNFTATNSIGVFSLTVAASTVSLTIRHSGYTTTETPPFAVSSGQTYDAGAIALERLPGTVTGRAVNSIDQAPIAEATVVASGSTASTVTDAGGAFTILLPARSYTITVSKANFVSRSMPADVTSGTTINIGTLSLDPYGIVNGRVVDASGEPVGGATVTAASTSAAKQAAMQAARLGFVPAAESGFSTTTDSNGEFTLALPPGAYTLTISKASYIAQTIGPISLVAGATAPPQAVHLDPAQLATNLTYAGPSSGSCHMPLALGAVLTETASGHAVAGRPVRFVLGSQSGSGVTDSNGLATVTFTPDDAPGAVALAIDFAGDSGHQPAQASATVRIDRAPTSIVFLSPLEAESGAPVTLQAKLNESATAAALPGRTVEFAIGDQSTSAQTDSAGIATATVTLSSNPGTSSISARFGGDACEQRAEISSSFRVDRVAVVLDYSGPQNGECNDPLILTARVRTRRTSLPVAQAPIAFHLGLQSMTATSDAEGKAEATIRPSGPPGLTSLSIVYDGDEIHDASQTMATLSIEQDQTAIAYVGGTAVAVGVPQTLAAMLFDPEDHVPISGRIVTFRIGAATVAAVTDGTGRASAPVLLNGGFGPAELELAFAGDETLRSGNATETLLLYQPQPFVVWGAGTPALKIGDRVNFWGSQWAKQIGSEGNRPDVGGFKGFATLPTGSAFTICEPFASATSSPPLDSACWQSKAGNSAPPASLPVYIGVIVATSIAQRQGQVYGNIAGTAVVKVDPVPAYGPAPDAQGFGTVVEVIEDGVHLFPNLRYLGATTLPLGVSANLTARLIDSRTRAPLGKKLLTFTIGATSVSGTTGEDGVATASMVVPSSEPAGLAQLVVASGTDAITVPVTLVQTASRKELRSRWTSAFSLIRGRGAAPLSLSRPARTMVGAQPGAHRYSLYTPELNLMAETETTTAPSPNIAWEYVWFGGQPLAQIENATGAIHYYFNDHLGTPLLTTDANGNVDWRAEYEPYGLVFALRSTDRHQPLRFPGQEAEQFYGGGNGLTQRSYNIFRWYRSSTGRYAQFDPIGSAYWPTALGPRIYSRAPSTALPQLANPSRVYPFSYAAANPFSNTDPQGLAVQTRGCDPPARCLETNRTRACCDCHDACFAIYNCSAEQDWAETVSYLARVAVPLGPTVPATPCVICNLWVTTCFIDAVLPNWQWPLCPWPETAATWPPNSGPRRN